MLLTARAEHVDLLQVLAATRRQIEIQLHTTEPPRKPRARQARRLRPTSEVARAQIAAALTDRGRPAFRGRVAIRLDIAMPAAYGLPRVVKEYVDLLRGLAFADDAVVDHIEVYRRPGEVGSTKTLLRCYPLAIFVADYDRAFRLWDEIGEVVPERGWGSHFDETDRELLRYEESVLGLIADLDAQEEEQLADDPDADVDLDLPDTMREFEDPDLRRDVCREFSDSVARRRARWLCDQGLDRRDRPGPSPAWLQEAHELDTTDVVGLPDRGPGCFLLPPPPPSQRVPGDGPWAEVVAENIHEQLVRNHMGSLRFEGPLALDVAFRGGCADHADVDNLAHQVLKGVQKALSGLTPDLRGYRAYRTEAGPHGVRLRLMPYERQVALGVAVRRARDVVRTQQAERRRAAHDHV